MKAKDAEAFLSCYRPGKTAGKTILKAVQMADEDPSLKEKLAAQGRFDDQLVSVIHSIEPPPNLGQKLGELASPKPIRSQIFSAGFLSVVAGVLMITGLFVWGELDRRSHFAGKEAVEHMVGVARDMTGLELQPTSALAGDLGDAFYMRGFEGFTVAPELARMQAVGSRVFKQGGHPVAQLAVDPHNALLYVFRASDFGVDLPRRGEWVVFSSAEFVAALREDSGFCSVLAFRGDKPEMERFLDSLKK